MPKISCIVPIYNVEKYLSRCIYSILSQTFTDFELILVDDGSPDNCPKICDEYAAKDSRIKVVHKKNGGLSDARNAGISVAKGEYICFVDSDDWIDKNYIKSMYDAAVDIDADFVMCGIKKQSAKDGCFIELNFNKTGKNIFCNSKDTFLKKIIQLRSKQKHAVQLHSACNKLYSKTLINNNRFDIASIGIEDYTFNLSLFSKINRAVFVPSSDYFYRYNENSAVHTFREENFNGTERAIELTRAFYEENNLNKKTLYKFVRYLVAGCFAGTAIFFHQTKSKNYEFYSRFEKYIAPKIFFTDFFILKHTAILFCAKLHFYKGLDLLAQLYLKLNNKSVVGGGYKYPVVPCTSYSRLVKHSSPFARRAA